MRGLHWRGLLAHHHGDMPGVREGEGDALDFFKGIGIRSDEILIIFQWPNIGMLRDMNLPNYLILICIF